MTVKKIAELASVSVGTVDRVINNRGNVSPEKKERIEKIIKETGFQPNLHARNLKLNKKRIVGFLTPSLSSEDGYWNLVNQGVKKAEEDLKDLSFIVKTFEYDRNNPVSFNEAVEALVKAGVEGCVIFTKLVTEYQNFIYNLS